MGLLIDTYNVLHAWKTGPSADGAAEVTALARAIRRAGRWPGEVRLVCDGAAPGDLSEDEELASAGCRVIYAGPGRDADTLIERLIEQESAIRELVVVSSDRRIMKAANRRGARAIGSDAFLSSLFAGSGQAGGRTPPRRAESLGEGEVAGWLEEFGFDPPGDEKSHRPDEPGDDAGIIDEPQRADEEASDLLREAEEMWPGLSGEELDMEHWIGGSDGEPKLDDK